MSVAAIGHNSGTDEAQASGLTLSQKVTIRQAILEMSESFSRIELERQIQKDIIQHIEEKFKIPKKLMRKLSRTYFSSDFIEQVTAQKQFEDMYNAIVRSTDEEETGSDKDDSDDES